MRRVIFRILALTSGLAIAGMTAAHHPPRMERCESFTFTGRIEQIEWRNPHVVLAIRADDGVSHRLTWLNLHQLERAGILRDTLHVGDQVVVTAGTRNDLVERPMLLSDIHRSSDNWEWSQVPQGC